MPRLFLALITCKNLVRKMKVDLIHWDINELRERAGAVRDQAKGKTVSYSLNVFLPLTRLCRNACGYCDYSLSETISREPFLPPDEVLATVRAGEEAGCTEALLVTGDKPELRYPEARDWLRDHHFDSTAHYVCETGRLVLTETRLYPHSNVGVASRADLAELKKVNVSIGLMLETTAERLGQPGEAHGRSPDKLPRARLDFLACAGALRIPTTTGLLIGIGETRQERVEALQAIRALHEEYGHIQEVIIQNFRPKPGSAMADVPDVPLSEMIWTCAAARLLLGPCLNLQVAPNLLPGEWLTACLRAGINDLGGVSPLTPDYVNCGWPWPSLAVLRRQTQAAGFTLRHRFPVYPQFFEFLPSPLRERLSRDSDEEGYVRTPAK